MDLVEILHRPGLDNDLKLFGLDYLFDNVLSIVNGTFEPRAVPAVKLFQWYSALIREVASQEAPWKSPWVCTLFQIKEGGARIRITPATFLDEVSGTTKNFQSEDVSSPFLSRKEFGNNLKRLLSERLRNRTMADRISPCPYVHFASHGSRHEGFANTHQHFNSQFNQQIRFHLLCIIILDNLYSISKVDKFSYRTSIKRYGPSSSLSCSSCLKSILMPLSRRLLHALEGALKPPGPLTGSKYTLKGDLIPEALEGFLTVKRWAIRALTALGNPGVELQLDCAAGSYTEAMKELTDGWERTANLDRLRSAVSKATHLLGGLLLDPPRLAWDGITLYRLREEGSDFSWAY
jgi:hypothetical protein